MVITLQQRFQEFFGNVQATSINKVQFKVPKNTNIYTPSVDYPMDNNLSEDNRRPYHQT